MKRDVLWPKVVGLIFVKTVLQNDYPDFASASVARD